MNVENVAAFVLIAGFAVISGVNDGGNLVGTFLPTRALPPRLLIPALVLSAGLGPFVFGTAVSHTIAVEILNFRAAGLPTLDVAAAASILTLLVSWWLKVPSSTTVALAGGMVGAALVHGETGLLHWAGVVKVLAGLFGSVIVGFLVSYVVTRGVWRALANASTDTARRLGYAQIATLMVQGLAYGANDQEKSIGLLTLFFVMSGRTLHYHVTPMTVLIPLVFWVAGLVTGGWRIARTVGGHIFRIRPMHSLTVQASAAATVLTAAFFGVPVSTTQTTDGSLFGLGTALAPRRVQWRTAYRLGRVWFTTLPLAVALGMAVMGSIRLIPHL